MIKNRRGRLEFKLRFEGLPMAVPQIDSSHNTIIRRKVYLRSSQDWCCSREARDGLKITSLQHDRQLH